ncbi:MAG: B12-binding domain-containing radical SAM protein [Lentisphaerae bacterium]|nr:B12-binding domain-containing radical SAM protein [Lentisphaerota bacterium]
MRILFVWPAVRNAEMLNFLPLGLGCLAANLDKKHNVALWDGVLGKLGDADFLAEIRRRSPDVVAFSIWNFNLDAVRRLASQVRDSFPDVTIVLGGPSVAGYGREIFSVIEADYAFVGEAEKTLPALLDALQDGRLEGKDLAEIDGLVYRNPQGDAVANAPEWPVLDDLVPCDYDFIHFRDYLDQGYRYGIHENAKRTAPVMTTRGCPFPCEYCSARLVSGTKVRRRPIESVVNEIRHLHEEYGIDGFNIIDDNFTFHVEYAKQVCRAILDLGLTDVSFCCPNGVKIEYLDDELLSLMKHAGWQCLFVAPESGSERTLKRMRKQIKLSEVPEKLAMIKSHGLKIFGFFMIGYPGETASDIRATIDFACRNPFDLAVFTCFQPIVGTPVYERLIDLGEIERSVEGIDYYNVSYAPAGMSIRRLKSWRLWCLLRFYAFSPHRLRTVLANYDLRRIAVFAKKTVAGTSFRRE